MPEFVLEISGSADAIELHPVGAMDAADARTVIDALDTLGPDVTPFAVHLDRVTTITPEARTILAARGVGAGLDEPVGSGTW
jgi:hypothetical protein